ncbi:MAG: ABC transporter ATP-binding protein [Candidatus Ranarchaeia archaeon]|jgi:ABC-type multidrug transport system fused ATPase/permease subunit
MGWVFSGLDKTDFERKYSDREMVSRLWHYVKPHKKSLVIVSFGLVFYGIFRIISPLFLIQTLDSLTTSTFDINSTLLLGILYLLFWLGQWVFDFLQQNELANFIPNVMVTLRTDVFDSIQRQDFKFFDKHKSGELATRVLNDASEWGGMILMLSGLSGNVVVLLGTGFILVILDIPLTLIAFSIIPVVVIFTLSFRKIARGTSMSYRKTVGRVNATMAESVSGITVSKAFGQESEEFESFKQINWENYRAGLRRGLSFAMLFPGLDLIYGICLFLIIQYGGFYIIGAVTGLTAPILYAFVIYMQGFFFPLMQLSTYYNNFQSGLAAFERILYVVDSEVSVKQKEPTIFLDSVEGEIEIRNLDFCYVEGEPVFQNFNLKIQAGEKLAIVGHTGSGKTSLASLIARFYEFQKGDILVDQRDIRTVDLNSYRRHLGLVQQDVFLFNGTVQENIIYGNRDAKLKDIEQALKAIKADEFIEYLSEGLATNVRERGSRLSLGQRQLVAFARALLANPRILILDEATSSVDAYTEAVIQEALETLLENRTAIIIAHRLSTVKNADRIIVLDKGKIIEEGKHDVLMAKGGFYADLYETYFKHKSPTWEPSRDLRGPPKAISAK